jgi:competence protein ComEA
MRLLVLLLLLSAISVARAEKTQLEGVINLNTASPEELRLIPGVGPARVRNVLAYRKSHPFRTIEELARIKGIGRKTVRRWRQHLAVSGPSTAQKVVRPETPFVGPPTLPPPMPVHRPSPSLPLRVSRPVPRRGEPSHALFQHAPGNACLPPP